jgi:DNA-binding NarL/FixJ family response regulator
MNRLMNKSDVGGSSRPSEGKKSKMGKPVTGQTIRVLLVDDHPVVRRGLSCCLAPAENLEVIGEAADGLEAVRKTEELSPHVVLMDIDMPGLNGLSATEILRRDHPAVRVLLLSMHPYTGQMSRILQCGARGFLLKDARPAELIAAICKVAAGETCFSQDVAIQALNQLASKQSRQPESSVLTEREREVLVGIAEGLTNKEIATRLGISSRTIETHRAHIMRKLNIHSVAGLTRFAASEGLVMVQEASKLTPPKQ